LSVRFTLANASTLVSAPVKSCSRKSSQHQSRFMAEIVFLREAEVKDGKIPTSENPVSQDLANIRRGNLDVFGEDECQSRQFFRISTAHDG
jgi:hypothetical protein